ncbi:NVEALA domain-containing protein [Bacteroides muris (ex Afrizal et al. 2022)]|jgi:hypothetical protein|uniref:NVEALA protein n=1 Tax=Bacteroides muris (ex Afrizal et al. 2022) TaxID=2516960 RepID=A0A4S2ACW0_9BACE|nr:NVEALA domain-containing protein [Bacteroides muris (ex Afrizal et al. 2022)]TGX98718.1 hypothetical protein E5355_18145 [Bacteroides muris (ex Afrizal et al. 2022)]
MNKIFKIALVAAVAAVAGYGVYANQKTEGVSDLMQANVEALAGSEGAAPCGGPKSNGECQSTNTVNCKDLSGCQ